MSNETKRDVFGKMKWELIRNLANTIDQNGGLRPLEDATKVGTNYAKRYAAALPDDMPVIPELIGKYLKMWKHDHGDLFQAFDEGTSASLDGTKWESVQDWFSDANDSFDTFARAWLDGVWRVEETGEIVKLESEE